MSMSPADLEQHSTAGTIAAWMQAARAGIVRPLARADVTGTDIDDEMILYNPADGSTHALNFTAALLWELCDGSRTLDEMATGVASDFAVPVEQARADTEALIEQMYTLGLLEPALGGAAPVE